MCAKFWSDWLSDHTVLKNCFSTQNPRCTSHGFNNGVGDHLRVFCSLVGMLCLLQFCTSLCYSRAHRIPCIQNPSVLTYIPPGCIVIKIDSLRHLTDRNKYRLPYLQVLVLPNIMWAFWMTGKRKSCRMILGLWWNQKTEITYGL